MAHLHEHCCSRSHEHHHHDHDHEGHHHHDHEAHESHEHHHDHEGHEHSHEHHHHEHSLKKQLWLILATVILLILAVLIERSPNVQSSIFNVQLTNFQLLLVYLVPYLLIGHETLHEAWEGITHGDAFNEHFLMSVATIGALCIGFLPGAETQYPEAVFVMLFFQVGELFEGYAEGKSRDSIAHLMDIRPDVAHVELRNEDVSPSSVAIGSVIIIRPGEKVPLDGVVIEGTSALNTVALTGESLPRDVNVGDEVISGCVNLSGVLRVRTTKAFGESTVSKIISLVEHAGERKSQSETFITRFARVYTPIVVFLALALAIIPPLCAHFSFLLPPSSFLDAFPTWLYRALMFLVVSCPCALVISVPLTFFGGIGGASRMGILVKGANYMDVLSKVDTVVFDKTGTLTHGQFAVEAVHSVSGDNSRDISRNEEGGKRKENTLTAELDAESFSESFSESASKHISFLFPPSSFLENQLLHLAAHVEHFSTHPIGAALRDAFPDEATDGCQVFDVEEIAGRGIRASVRLADSDETYIVCVGNTKMMDVVGAHWHDCHHVGTIIHVAIDGEYAGHIVINDQIKSDSAEAIAALKALGVKKTVMLTGDRREVADHVAKTLGLDEYHAELLPADKVRFIDEISRSEECGVSSRSEECGVRSENTSTAESSSVLSAESSSEDISLHTPHSTLHKKRHLDKTLAFVGDGINDAPVLARADVGIAMGGLGSDAAIEAADVVLMDDKPSKIALAIRIARRTLGIARQNVVFAIGVKVAVLILAAFGIATMWLAVFADVGVTVLAVLNAMRALRVK